MKKLTAAALALLLAIGCLPALADRAVIPYTMADFTFDRIRPVPVLKTKHSEATMSTRAVSDIPLDWVNVNMDTRWTAVALDEGGLSFSYSTAGLKRQVGIWWSGTHREDVFLTWVDPEECPTEREALDYAREEFGEYATYGYAAEPGMFWDLEVYGIETGGEEALLGTVLGISQDDYEDARALQEALEPEWAERYPACAAFRFSVTDDYQSGWNLFAVGALKVYSFSGDDAYMAAVGNQVSVHGRDGVPHTVYAYTDKDLFDTDMECSGTTLTWKKNGNTGVWYVDTVESTYENSFTAVISAHYLHDRGTSLVNYDITYINEGITYTVHYAPDGKQLRASAQAPFGNFITAGPDSEWEWVNTETCRFETAGRLLPLRQLFLVRYH